MKSFWLAFLICCGSLHTAQCQRTCSTSAYTNKLLSTDPSFKTNAAKAELEIQATINRSNRIARRDTALNEIINIPVVVHVLYKNAAENISDAQVRSQIEVLNQDFSRLNPDAINTPSAFLPIVADTRIRFCLAQVDPLGRKTNGIDRKYTNRDFFVADDAMKSASAGGANPWNNKQYLNIWVVKLNGSSLAYATPPGADAEKDGVVIAYDVFGNTGQLRPTFNKGRTATHEIGHWLGLIHTWGDQNCGDDHVDDTPAQEAYNFGCPTFPKLSSCSPNGDGDMFMNFMDFSDDACMNAFTRGQAQRMRALFANGNMRNSFLNAYACDSNLIQQAPLPDTLVAVKTPVQVSLTDTKVFPNPVHGLLTIDAKLAAPLQVQTVHIYNSVGMLVYSGKLNQQRTTHDLGKLAGGVYSVQITDGKSAYTTKVVKL